MFRNFTEEAKKILISAKKEMYDLKHPYVGSEHLLLAMLNSKNNISSKLKEYGLDYKKLKKEIVEIIGVGTNSSEWFLYTPLLKRIMENATIDSKENNKGEVTIEHLFSSLLEEGEGVAIRIMIGMKLDLDKLYNEFSYKIFNKNKSNKNKKLVIDELGLDLNKEAIEGNLDPVVGREEELKRVIEILCRRTKNNPLLIGEPGVGKTAIVEELSKKIVEGDVPQLLRNKKIISLDMASTVAGTKYRGEFEDRIKKIINEIEEDKDIILFIDEIHTLVGAGGAEGAIDASNIFKPALARGKIKCIGATTTTEYKKFIEPDGALERRFQKVNVEVPNDETVENILLTLKEIHEKFHNVSIKKEMIKEIVKLSNKYIYNRNQPDAAIDVLDEVCSKVSLKEDKNYTIYNELLKKVQKVMEDKNKAIINNNFDEATQLKDQEKKLMNDVNNLEMKLYKKNQVKEVTIEDIAEVINIKTKIPVYEILKDDVKMIKVIETKLKENIIGQNKAVDEVINLFKRIKLGFKNNKCYSYLFVGPTGVGKTELAKVYGDCLVGKNNIIKLDMSEYSSSHDVSKIIGSPPGYVGYSDNKNVLEEIRNKPNSVLILDEIEKAHPTILSLLFQILDDGKLKDSVGRVVRFDNVIIIMTSNIGFLNNEIGFNFSKNNKIKEKLKETFSLPLINRIENIIIFEQLEEISIKKIINKKLKEIKDKYNEFNIKFKKDIVDTIVKKANYPEEGVRAINKFLNDNIENYIIDEIIKKNNNITV